MDELFSATEVERRIAELGKDISGFYRGKLLTVIAIANGGCFFGCDLARAIDTPLWFDTIRVSSYRHDTKCGTPVISCEPKLPVAGRHILLVDDVLDSGDTMQYCSEKFSASGAASVRSAVLVAKDVPGRRCRADWTGFNAPDRYLIGCGLDSDELYRNLRYIGAMQ